MKHLLILFCDQFRYDAIGAFGNPAIQTPHLDALASESVRFHRCLTPSPVCVPARLSLLAGQYPARTGNNQNNKHIAYTGNGFYSRITESGFHSCCVGKMHHTFDPYAPIGFSSRCTQEEMTNLSDDYTNFILQSPYRTVFDYNGQRSELYYVPQVSQLPAEVHPTQWVGDKSVEFLQNCNPEQPVFLFSSFIHPHPPFCPPAPWNKLYRTDETPEAFVPENVDELKPLLHTAFDTTPAHLDFSHKDLKRLKNFYYACVSFVDYQIGRILNTLKERGMYEDTAIVFTCDHGECLGDYLNMGKRTMLEPAAHIPLMIKIPGVEASDRDDVCSLVDLAPTLLSLCKIPYDPAEYDGVDLFRETHDYVYSQYSGRENGYYMIASAKEKLIFSAADGKYYYFDSFPETVSHYDGSDPHQAEMKALLDAYYQSDREPSDEIGKGKKKKPKTPNYFGCGWMDHTVRREEESARIPDEYRIFLP